MDSEPREVWARGAWAAVDTVRAAGLPIQALFAGLPFDERALRSRTRVPWDYYVLIVERMNDLCGGWQQVEALIESTYHKVMPEVRSLAGAALTPIRLVKFLWEVLDPFVFPMATWRAEDLGDDRLRLVTRLHPGFRPCATWFWTSRGAIRSMTRHLDLPPIEILAEDVSDTHSVYDVQLPEPPSFAQRALRIPSAVRKLAVRIALGATHDGTPVTVQLDEQERDPYQSRMQLAIRVWRLTAHEADLLRLLVEGHTDQGLASTFGVSAETIEGRIMELAAKAGVPSRTQLIVRFWAQPLDR